MPIQMQRNQPIGGGVIDLYSPYLKQQQEAQAQKQADWQGIMQAVQQIAQYKAQQDFMKQQGITRQEPVMGTFDQSMLNKYRGNLGQFSPEAQAQLRGMAQDKITIPTGKTRTAYDFSKLPYGVEISIPGTGFTAKGTRQGIQEVPEGFEVAGYNAEGQPYVKKIKPEQELVPAINRQTGQPILDSEGNPVYIDKKSKLIGKSSLNDLIGDLIKNEVLPKSKENKEKIKSPYKEYPDAFQENSVWKVIRNGKKYKIEG